MDINILVKGVVEHLLGPIAALLFGVAIVFFVWGIIQLMQNSDSTDGIAKGKRNIIYGLIGIVIMLSVLGIKNIVVNSIPGAQDPTNSVFGS